jgi:hypothetical protein
VQPRPTIAYVIDPRFPGGTSSGVAAELRAVADLADISIHAIDTRMFAGRPVAPVIERALADLKLVLDWDRETVHADLILIHNPAFLKFESDFRRRLFTRRLVVVAQENFLRPGGDEGFAVGHCLGLIDAASLALHKLLAPVSPWNRTTVQDWLAGTSEAGTWQVHERDWFHLCDFPLVAPTPAPRDRRGRLSRPGFEKFPSLVDMELCFPPHAEANIILGGDTLRSLEEERPHWQIHPFRSLEPDKFFGMIDFMVYFTSPEWRESFGRVLAEAIAAGKLVICDHASAAGFPDAVIAARPEEVDAIVARFVADPSGYRRQVEKSQRILARFSSGAFRPLVKAALGQEMEGVA